MADFPKFDNVSHFLYCQNLVENYRSNFHKNGKDASQRDLNLSIQNFYSKMNSLAVIFKKTEENGENRRLLPF